MKTYTVLVKNELLGKAHYTGTFESYGEAEAYAQQQASRTRKFAVYEVWEGTPRNAIRQSGSQSWRGEK